MIIYYYRESNKINDSEKVNVPFNEPIPMNQSERKIELCMIRQSLPINESVIPSHSMDRSD